jgi:hypothetical protein
MRKRGEHGGVFGLLLVCLAAVAALAIFAFVHAVHGIGREFRVEHRETKNGDSVRVSTPVGSVRLQSHRALDITHLGIPVYPGAILEKGNRGASIELESDNGSQELIVVAGVYSTDDPVSAVREFYRKEMPHWILTKDGIELTEKGYKKIITITRKHGKTWIAVASLGEPAAN